MLVAVALLVLALPSPAEAQPGPRKPRKRRVKRSKLHYPLSSEAKALLRTADRARKKKDWATACTLYRSVLDQDENSVVPHPDAEPGEPLRLIGVKEWAIRSLRSLPAEGVAVWREKYDYRAASAFKVARSAPRSDFELATVYDLYPISSCAKEILTLLADRSLQRGELGRAGKNLRLLLRHHGPELGDDDPIHRKLLLCAIGLGDPEAVDKEARALLHGNEKKVLIGRSLHTPAELVAQALQREAERTGRYRGSAATGLHTRGGLANRACFDGEPIMGGVLVPRFQFGEDMPDWRGGSRARYRSRVTGSSPPRSMAVVYDGQVFIPGADQLHTLDLETGRPRRRMRRPANRPIYPDDDNDKVQYGACVGQATLVAPLVEQVQRDQSFRGIPIKVKIPRRKLCAFDLEAWRWRWDHAKSLKGTPFEAWSFPSTPTAHEGRVYSTAWSIEGYVNSNVACFDLQTGKPLWGALIASGQVEQTMFGEQAAEPLCTPLALVDGVLYVVSQIGCVAALDADTGRLLWLTEYDTIQVRAAKGYFPDHRDIRWENNAPIVESGVVIAAPLDSWAFFGFNRETGKRLWRASQRLGGSGTESDMRYLIGADRGRVVLAGGGDVRCVDVQSGLLKWRSAVGTRQVAGRGCLLGGRACIPLDDGSVAMFDLDRGHLVGQARLSIGGNLLPCGRALVVVGGGSVAVHRLGAQSPGKDFK
ncbi:MAG: PQQ-like beta-propeller repeat protein [Planctomycetes bacterium]|nr:PQQ-like beta-propeller repeat protein [Planctomycetota bacterium]